MKQICSIGFSFYLFWFAVVMFFNLKGDIVFGHGLGDLYYLIGLIFFSIVGLILFLKIAKEKVINKKKGYSFVIYLVIVMALFCLKLTLFRGAEYPWDCTIFM
jgi:hypothetical protein